MFHILLLEDDPDDAEFLCDLLGEYAGDRFRVIHVTQVEEAEALVAEEHFDLLLVDYQLGNGYALQRGTDFILDCFRRGERIPSILISAHPRVLLCHEILELSASGEFQFLSKMDLNPGMLLSAVFRGLTQRVRHGHPATAPRDTMPAVSGQTI